MPREQRPREVFIHGAEVPGEVPLKHAKSLIMSAPGIRRSMDREDLPDEVPVADAVEQQRETTGPVEDEEAFTPSADAPPLEATEPDWQEQREAVDLDPELDEFGREE